jgi:exodeoxyribonuclease VII large subunit
VRMAIERETFKEKPIYTLTEISKSLHSVIAKNYPRPYYIKAEIVKLNYYPHSGHCYPELAEKEGNIIKTQMRAIIWSSAFREINDRFVKLTGEPMKEGINILCLATIEYDVKYGLSLHIQNVEPTYTLGDMVKNKLLVIERLKKEGIFKANKERKLVLIPKRIAVISVETSKGYADFMVTLANNPYHYKFECTLFPSILQGDKAIRIITEKLTEIEGLVDFFDSVVIIRGGGGDVGLSCYDDYQLAARVATFPLPVISGIGHSTNETITDMVSFQSKITPTDVANFFIDQYRKVDQVLEDSKHAISKQVARRVATEKSTLQHYDENLSNIAIRVIYRHAQALQSIEEKIALLSPESILKRGFSITYFQDKTLKNSDKVKKEDLIITRLYHGEIRSRVEETKNENNQ